MTNRRGGRVAGAILEMADDLHRLEIMDCPTHEKITLRHIGKGALTTAESLSSVQKNVDIESTH